MMITIYRRHIQAKNYRLITPITKISEITNILHHISETSAEISSILGETLINNTLILAAGTSQSHTPALSRSLRITKAVI
jgi:hypothetical protein